MTDEGFFTQVGFVEWNVQQDRGRPFADAVADLSARFPEYAELIEAFDERWGESVGGAIQGTVGILRLLHRAGHPLYGLSNWSAEKFPTVRGRYDFFELFSDIVISGEVRLVKPDPRIFALFLRRTGLAASECIYIDDSAANIGAARELGFTTILFESPERLELELRRMGLLLPGGTAK